MASNNIWYARYFRLLSLLISDDIDVLKDEKRLHEILSRRCPIGYQQRVLMNEQIILCDSIYIVQDAMVIKDVDSNSWHLRNLDFFNICFLYLHYDVIWGDFCLIGLLLPSISKFFSTNSIIPFIHGLTDTLQSTSIHHALIQTIMNVLIGCSNRF
jgi:hypothetical protein